MMDAQLKLYRTCHLCKACLYGGGLYYCRLDFPIDAVTGRPTEPCPKPKTVAELAESRGRWSGQK